MNGSTSKNVPTGQINLDEIGYAQLSELLLNPSLSEVLQDNRIVTGSRVALYYGSPYDPLIGTIAFVCTTHCQVADDVTGRVSLMQLNSTFPLNNTFPRVIILEKHVPREELLTHKSEVVRRLTL